MATNPEAPTATPPSSPETQETQERPKLGAEFRTSVDHHDFVGIKNNLIFAAQEVNRMPDFATGSKLESPDDFEAFMPGIQRLAKHQKEALGRGRGPEPEEKAFLEAMKWKAEFWHEKAKREPIEVSDYDNDPNPLAYSDAMDAAISKLANQELAKRDEAERHGNAKLAEKYYNKSLEIERYRQLFNARREEDQFTPNQHLADEYLKAVKEPLGAHPGRKKLMNEQKEYDYIYATHNTAIKKEMRKKLDEDDAEEVRKSQLYIDNQLSTGLGRKYKQKQSGAGLRTVSADKTVHDNFDNEVIKLVDTEASILARKARDEGKKFEGDKLDEFLVNRTDELYSGLGKNIAAKHKGKWNFKRKKEEREGLARALLYAVTGRNLEGTKVKKGWEKHAKRGFRLGGLAVAFALASATGATFLVAGAAAGGHYYLNKRAKRAAENVANVKGGIPSKDALKLAVKSVSGDRLAKIIAANKLNKESQEKITQKRRQEHVRHILGTSAWMLAGGVLQYGGAEFAYDRFHDVTGAISDEWHSWGDAWSIDERPQVPPAPDMPDWYWQSPEELGLPHN